ncbi:hypothetical protein SSX86_019926 [Deinandra increscens subsp. villosa]|uniref:Protein FAR1-RELATED SEQUENCE n=1 Tax=Deinandra increscens subsp. villosa TaxID=3103831 RepID=A0AAP0CYM5_9ASTR
MDVTINCRQQFSNKGVYTWDNFTRDWSYLCESSNEQLYQMNRNNIYKGLLKINRPDVLEYLDKNWLIDRFKVMFISAWTNKARNFEQHTTSRVKSEHTALKLYLRSTNASLQQLVKHVHGVVDSQTGELRDALATSKIKVMRHHRDQMFDHLRGRVSHKCLDLLDRERDRMGKFHEMNVTCGCQLFTGSGLPCACRLERYEQTAIPLGDIDPFWQKLDIDTPAHPYEEEPINYEADFEEIKKTVMSKPENIRRQYMEKLKGVFNSSGSGKREPLVKTDNRGRPPSQAKEKKSREQHRHISYTSPDKTTPDLPRHSSYVGSQEPKMHPGRSSQFLYKHELPPYFHEYITVVKDVVGDGNCGFSGDLQRVGLQPTKVAVASRRTYIRDGEEQTALGICIMAPRRRNVVEGVVASPYLQFAPGTVGFQRKTKITNMPVGGTMAADFSWIVQIQGSEQLEAVVGHDTPWMHLFRVANLPTYRELLAEFLCTFTYSEPSGPMPQAPPAHREERQRIAFSMFGTGYMLTLREFAVLSGLYTEDETCTPFYTAAPLAADEDNMKTWWTTITRRRFGVNSRKITSVPNPVIRYVHRLITCSITARGEGQELVTSTDLFYLYSMVHQLPCALAHCFARFLAKQESKQQRSTLYCGAYVTRIAMSLGVLDDHIQMLSEAIPPRRLGKNTMIAMGLLDKSGTGRNAQYRFKAQVLGDDDDEDRDKGCPACQGGDEDDDDDGGVAHEDWEFRYAYRAVRMPPRLGQRLGAVERDLRHVDDVQDWQNGLLMMMVSRLDLGGYGQPPPRPPWDDEDDD